MSFANEQITTRKETLDYYISWCSLHRAHIIAPKECAATLFSWTLVAIALSILVKGAEYEFAEQILQSVKAFGPQADTFIGTQKLYS